MGKMRWPAALKLADELRKRQDAGGPLARTEEAVLSLAHETTRIRTRFEQLTMLGVLSVTEVDGSRCVEPCHCSCHEWDSVKDDLSG